MRASLSPADAELDARWRAAFDGPLPMLGAPDVALAIHDAHDGGMTPIVGPDHSPDKRGASPTITTAFEELSSSCETSPAPAL